MTTVPGVRFLPNAITVLAFCSGLSSVYFATQAQARQISWIVVVGAIGAAAILDSLDGPAARLLNSTSRIGAELDSLSDAVSFGVAPALIVFVWRFQGRDPFGWVFCLLFAVCIALRLARFNSLLESEPRPWAKGFFTGVPAPAAGLLAMVPIVLSERENGWSFTSSFWFVVLWLSLVAALAVSRLPSIAPKSVRVPAGAILPLLLVLVLAVAAAFFQPGIMLAIGLVVYLLHLPYAGWKYRHLQAHPELWDDRTIRPATRTAGRRIRLSVRVPRRQRVAGRAPDGSPLPLERRRGAQIRRGMSGRRRLP